jgi:hypothetical protein
MSLLVCWYRDLQVAEDVTISDSGECFRGNEEVDVAVLEDNNHFPGCSDGAVCGLPLYYADSGIGGEWSYDGYSAWRDDVKRMVYHAAKASKGSDADLTLEAAGGPFWELLNFSDARGTIGPVVAKKLAKDFDEFYEHAEMFPSAHGASIHFFDRYKTMREAFRAAAHGGAVSFG